MSVHSLTFWPPGLKPSREVPDIIEREPAHSGALIKVKGGRRLRHPEYQPPSEDRMFQFNRPAGLRLSSSRTVDKPDTDE